MVVRSAGSHVWAWTVRVWTAAGHPHRDTAASKPHCLLPTSFHSHWETGTGRAQPPGSSRSGDAHPRPGSQSREGVTNHKLLEQSPLASQGALGLREPYLHRYTNCLMKALCLLTLCRPLPCFAGQSVHHHFLFEFYPGLSHQPAVQNCC